MISGIYLWGSFSQPWKRHSKAGETQSICSGKFMLSNIHMVIVSHPSIIITSQGPVTEWQYVIGEKTIADAILDRAVQNAHSMALAGESFRKRQRNKFTENVERNK
jgi:DNA replication protein DnaC